MNEEPISEATSENPQPKRKRGRPARLVDTTTGEHMPLHDASFWTDHGLWVTNAGTTRGNANEVYATIAIARLRNFFGQHRDVGGWLVGFYFPDAGTHVNAFFRKPRRGRCLGKWAVLTELGRIILAFSDGLEAAQQWALELYQRQPRPTVKQAVAELRAWRLRSLGKAADISDRAATQAQIGDAVCAALDRLLEKYPATREADILAALELCACVYDSACWAPEPDGTPTDNAVGLDGHALHPQDSVATRQKGPDHE